MDHKNYEHQHHNKNQKSKNIYTCPMHPEIRQYKPGNCPICGTNLVLAEKTDSTAIEHITSAITDAAITQHQFQKYTCPMHPHILRDAPGKCPLCGMKLEPVAGATSHSTDGKHDKHPGMIADFRVHGAGVNIF